MLKRPQVKRCFSVEIVEPDEVFLLGERNQQVFTGNLHREIWPLLTGKYTSLELIQKLEGNIPFPDIIYFLGEMERLGYLIEAGPPNVPASEVAFYHTLGVDAQTALDRLGSMRVSVRVIAGVSEGPLVVALTGAGVRVEASGDFEVVVTDDYIDNRLASINECNFADGRPWIVAALSGTQIWLGPIFPGQGAPCWACLSQRIRANRQMSSYIGRKQGREDAVKVPHVSLRGMLGLGASLLALEVAKYVVRPEQCPLLDHLITVDMLTLESKHHRVVIRPQCAVCGRADAWGPRTPVTLRNGRKHISIEGEKTFVAANETLARYTHHVSQITGVVTWLVETTPDRSGLSYTYSAGHSFPLIQDDLYWLVRNLRSNAGGKGTTQSQAQVSALGEAFERYSISYHGDEPCVRGSHRSMGLATISLGNCLGFSDNQYSNRETWNAGLQGTRLHAVPRPIGEDQDIEWVRHLVARIGAYWRSPLGRV